jgi:hypothetical protein
VLTVAVGVGSCPVAPVFVGLGVGVEPPPWIGVRVARLVGVGILVRVGRVEPGVLLPPERIGVLVGRIVAVGMRVRVGCVVGPDEARVAVAVGRTVLVLARVVGVAGRRVGVGGCTGPGLPTAMRLQLMIPLVRLPFGP